jgi:molecular chaperone DnaK
VLQGERPLASENKSLGRFVLDGIPPAPRGTPQIEVAFDIDANGILNVSATDKATGKEQRVVITPTSGLSQAEIDRMIREAAQHASEDSERRLEVELLNRADTVAYAGERLLRDSGDSLPSELKLQIDELVGTIRRGLDAHDVAGVRQATEALEEAMARAAQAPQPVGAATGGRGSGGGSDGGGADGSVDAEFREV